VVVEKDYDVEATETAVNVMKKTLWREDI